MLWIYKENMGQGETKIMAEKTLRPFWYNNALLDFSRLYIYIYTSFSFTSYLLFIIIRHDKEWAIYH